MRPTFVIGVRLQIQTIIHRAAQTQIVAVVGALALKSMHIIFVKFADLQIQTTDLQPARSLRLGVTAEWRRDQLMARWSRLILI
jgi:hypothetical protein